MWNTGLILYTKKQTLGQGARVAPYSLVAPLYSKASWKNVGLHGVCICFGFGERIKWTRLWSSWYDNATRNFWARTAPAKSCARKNPPLYKAIRLLFLHKICKFGWQCCFYSLRPFMSCLRVSYLSL